MKVFSKEKFIREQGINHAKMWVVMGLPAKVTHWMPLPEPPKEER